MLTGRSLKALLDNLHAEELDLPIEFCVCWCEEEYIPYGMADVTSAAIKIHRVEEIIPLDA